MNDKELEILNDVKLYEQMHTNSCTSVFYKMDCCILNLHMPKVYASVQNMVESAKYAFLL